jgi:uncharacterized protein (DUF983 family)
MCGAAGARLSTAADSVTNDMGDAAEEASADPLILSSAKGLCPQCGAQTLFDGAVKFAPRCRVCGLDYTQFNVGDGPAAFLTMIVGALILGLALLTEFKAHPPIWLHLLLWPVLTVVCVTGSLRIAKAMLLTLEFRNKAHEGALVMPPDKGA